MIKPSVTLKSIAASIISTAGLVTIVADRTSSIVDNSLGMIDDLAADGHDSTSMSGAFNRLERRQKFIAKYKDCEFSLPPELESYV